MAKYVMAIDQGTTSTRAIIFDDSGIPVESGQAEHEQILPRAGWVEHDPLEIWRNVREVSILALTRANLSARDLAAVGITNQRETTLVWDRHTGDPIYNAVVWQDTRTHHIIKQLAGDEGKNKYAERTGLPLATYFAGPKIKWILDNVDGARLRAEAGDLLFGTIDSWLLWNMTGGPTGGAHLTDVTNASRTMLMNIDTLDWNKDIVREMSIPLSMLPEIRSSSEVYGVGRGDGIIPGVPIAGILGDQQAATFGQACFKVGAAKNTYGTGNFLLLNTGTNPVRSRNGLVTTVGYQLGSAADPVYCLEGSIAVTGSLVQWLRDNLGIIKNASEIEELASNVEDTGGAYFVPAFSGLFAPHWRSEARGVLVGLTRFVDKRHIARAVLEATAFQTREVVEAMNNDSGVELKELRVDGGMVANQTLMQFQADLLDVPVLRPKTTEITAAGAAYAAGIAVGYWKDEQEVIANWSEKTRWEPHMNTIKRERIYRKWKKAVTKTFDWLD